MCLLQRISEKPKGQLFLETGAFSSIVVTWEVVCEAKRTKSNFNNYASIEIMK